MQIQCIFSIIVRKKNVLVFPQMPSVYLLGWIPPHSGSAGYITDVAEQKKAKAEF